jgi:methyltransferase (TIGR00027 family)
MRDRLAATGFYALSALLSPITVLGYVIWVGQGLVTWRASKVSGSAQGPLSARWTMHQLGVRRDEAASRLLPLLPGVPILGMRLSSAPTLLAHRLTGFVPRAFRYPFEGDVPKQYQASARVTFLDDVVNRYLADIEQFVVLGAGFDTRPYRFAKDTRVRSFEVDTPATQAVKRATLARAGIDATSVTFVSADFETDDWLARLVEAGFDPAKPALFLWEGVTIYLSRDAVKDTLRKIAGTAKKSAVAFDYFTTEALESGSLYWRYGRAAAHAAGEPLRFGVDRTPPSRERLAELLRSCGLTLREQRTLGHETDTERAWGGFAVAVVE